MHSKEIIDRDELELAAGRCPECSKNIAHSNVCSCGHSNPLQAVFCGACGKAVVMKEMTAEERKEHAESHWGKDFHLTKAEGDASDPCIHCGATFEGKSDQEVKDHFIHGHLGVVHDETLFPDAVRRWHKVVEYKMDAKAVANAPAPAKPKRVFTVGAEIVAEVHAGADKEVK